MSTVKLEDILGVIAKNQSQFDAAARGETPGGAWDGPPLPMNQEYRAIVDSAEIKDSKNSGKPQIVITFEVQEPEEWRGRKLQDYYNPTPTEEFASRKLSEMFGALQANTDGWGNSVEDFVKQFEGKTAVIATRHWGEDMDRTGVRWVNLDKGQELRSNIIPPKPPKNAQQLRPEIVIPKPEDTATVAASAPAQLPLTEATTVATPPTPGPNLPPGLRG